jgi:hypothetical protein
VKLHVHVPVRVLSPTESYEASAPVYKEVATDLPPGEVADILRAAVNAAIEGLPKESKKNGTP